LVLSLAFLASTVGARSAPNRRPPNILILITDDQRADTLHALGNPHLHTPNLDRLVATGTAFTRAYIMGGLQGAVCVPSRAMLLSGGTLFGAREDLKDVETWPMKLEQAGYRTFITGKWHNQAASVTRSFAEGEAIFLGGMTDQFKVRVQDIGPGRALVNERTETKFSAELFADAAIRLLKRPRGDRPFCLYVAFTTPHDPRSAPSEFRQRYDPANVPVPKNFLPQHPFDNGELRVRDERLLPWPRAADAIRREIADYSATLSATDAQIGRILTSLKETGQFDHTIIVFCGDNGLALGSHGLLGKQNLYEYSMRLPLLIAGPGLPKGKRAEAFCYLLDLCPTVCELAGVAPPSGSQGRSLVPLLRGRQRELRGSIFTAYRHLQRAVRDERWKLIHYPELGRWQLFDLRADPEELRDLAYEPKHTRQLRKLQRELANQQGLLGDPLAPAHASDLAEAAQPSERPIIRWTFESGRKATDWPGDFEVVEHAPDGPPSRVARAISERDGKAVRLRLQIEPPLPVGAHTRLRFSYHLAGTDTMTVQMFDATVQDNRHIHLRDLQQGQWTQVELDFTHDSRHNDGTRDTFTSGNRVDDLFFLVGGRGGPQPVLLIDDVVLCESLPTTPTR
jgi:arylsulfatase A-like enzyme